MPCVPMQVHLVMELCSGGTIYERITARHFTENSAARVARSILQMIAQCHSKGVVYLDVKPENFLYLTPSDDSVLKGTDFGLALRYPQDMTAGAGAGGRGGGRGGGGRRLVTRRGTPVYMAPEVILKDYDNKVDCWSAGVLIFQLLHGRLPYIDKLQGHTVREVWELILNSKLDFSEDAWQTFSDDARDLVARLLDRDPAKRLSAIDALKHPWLQDTPLLSGDGQGYGSGGGGEGEGGGSGSGLGLGARDLPLQKSIIQRLQRFGTYSFLKQIVLANIAEEAYKLSSMTPQIQRFFNSLDKDASGTISFSELTQGLQGAGYVLATSEISQLMQSIDIDGNGVLDLNEVFASLVDWEDLHSDEHWPDWCNKMFDKLDADHSGAIDLDEITKLLPANMIGQRRVNAMRMLREVDTNEDGKISYEEFMRMMNAEDEFLLVEFDSRLSLGSGDSMSDSVDWTTPDQDQDQDA